MTQHHLANVIHDTSLAACARLSSNTKVYPPYMFRAEQILHFFFMMDASPHQKMLNGTAADMAPVADMALAEGKDQDAARNAAVVDTAEEEVLPAGGNPRIHPSASS